MEDKTKDRDLKGRLLPGAKCAIKHGLFTFKITGKIPSVRGAKALMYELTKIRSELEAITPAMNIKKSLLIEQIVKARGFMRLFEMYCKKNGIVNPRLEKGKVIDFQPGFKTYMSFANQQHKAIVALGLSTEQADDVLNVQDYIKQFDEQEAKKKEEKKQEKEGKDND